MRSHLFAKPADSVVALLGGGGTAARALRATIAGCLLVGMLAHPRSAEASVDAGTGGEPLDRTAGPPIERALAKNTGPTACSFRLPLCVRGSTERDVLRVLAAAETMWFTAETLDWSLPSRLTLELIPSLEADVRVHFTQVNPMGAYDLAYAQVELLPTLTGCSLDHAILRGILGAATFARSPGWKESVRDGWAAAMVDGVLACEGNDRIGRTLWAQANPQSDPLGLGRETRAEATAAPEIFFRWLDAHYGRSVLPAVSAMTASHTPGGSDHWVNEPDLFDVLDKNLKGLQFRDSTFFDVLCDFGMDRFYFGRDLVRFPESARLPAVSADWDIPWPEVPRRLLGPKPLSPFGSTYVLVNLAGSEGKGLRMEADWETFARIRWHFVKLDAQRHELARIPIPAPDKATSAQMSLRELGPAAYLLIVGTSLGDPVEAFDPDWSSMEPHNYTITLSGE